MQDDDWGISYNCALGCKMKENLDFSKHWIDCTHKELLVSQEFVLCENNINHLIKKEDLEKHYETCIEEGNNDLLILCFRAQIKELQQKFENPNNSFDEENANECIPQKKEKLQHFTSNHIQINKHYIRSLYSGNDNHNETIKSDTIAYINFFLS